MSKMLISFLPSAIREWNNLPLDVRTSESLYSFKRRLNDRNRVVPNIIIQEIESCRYYILAYELDVAR